MGGSDHFTFHLNKFESSIKSCWNKLQIENDFFDVTLAVDDEQIRAHKIVISSCSPVLRNILKGNLHPHPLIFLRKFQYRDLKNLVTFMYQGKVNVNKEDLNGFIEAATDLQIRGLSQSNTEDTNSKEDDVSSPKLNGEIENKSHKISVINSIRSLTEGQQRHDDFINNSNFQSPASEAKSSFHSKQDEDESTQHIPQLIDSASKRKLENERNNTMDLNSIKHPSETHKSYDYFIHSDSFNYNTKEHEEESSEYISPIRDIENESDNTMEMSSLRPFIENSDTCDVFGNKNSNSVNFQSSSGSQIELVRHVKGKENDDSLVLAPEGQHFICAKCEKVFLSQSGLYRHNQSIHEGVYYWCDQCDYKAKQKKNLKIHVNISHLKIAVMENCGKCDEQFSSSPLLWQHNQKVHLGVRYPCEYCDYKSIQKFHLTRHKLRHHKNKEMKF